MVCSKCGNQVPAGGKFCNVCGQAMPEAPATQPAAQDNPVSKFINGTSLNFKILWGALVAAVLVVILMMNAGINGLLLDLPILSMIDGEEVEDRREALEVLEDFDEDEYEEFIDEYDIAHVAADPEDYGESEDDGAVFGVFQVVIIILGLLAQAGAVTGVIFKKTPLAIVGAVLAAILGLFFGGIVLMIIALVAYVALIVFLGKVKAEA